MYLTEEDKFLDPLKCLKMAGYGALTLVSPEVR